jgi:hypothetical protein
VASEPDFEDEALRACDFMAGDYNPVVKALRDIYRRGREAGAAEEREAIRFEFRHHNPLGGPSAHTARNAFEIICDQIDRARGGAKDDTPNAAAPSTPETDSAGNCVRCDRPATFGWHCDEHGAPETLRIKSVTIPVEDDADSFLTMPVEQVRKVKAEIAAAEAPSTPEAGTVRCAECETVYPLIRYCVCGGLVAPVAGPSPSGVEASPDRRAEAPSPDLSRRNRPADTAGGAETDRKRHERMRRAGIGPYRVSMSLIADDPEQPPQPARNCDKCRLDLDVCRCDFPRIDQILAEARDEQPQPAPAEKCGDKRSDGAACSLHRGHGGEYHRTNLGPIQMTWPMSEQREAREVAGGAPTGFDSLPPVPPAEQPGLTEAQIAAIMKKAEALDCLGIGDARVLAAEVRRLQESAKLQRIADQEVARLHTKADEARDYWMAAFDKETQNTVREMNGRDAAIAERDAARAALARAVKIVGSYFDNHNCAAGGDPRDNTCSDCVAASIFLAEHDRSGK